MTIKVINATNLRSNLSGMLNGVSTSKDTILVRRRRNADVALISTDLLEDLLEMHDKDYVKSIEEARRSVNEGQTFSYDEVFG